MTAGTLGTGTIGTGISDIETARPTNQWRHRTSAQQVSNILKRT